MYQLIFIVLSCFVLIFSFNNCGKGFEALNKKVNVTSVGNIMTVNRRYSIKYTDQNSTLTSQYNHLSLINNISFEKRDQNGVFILDYKSEASSIGVANIERKLNILGFESNKYKRFHIRKNRAIDSDQLNKEIFVPYLPNLNLDYVIGDTWVAKPVYNHNSDTNIPQVSRLEPKVVNIERHDEVSIKIAVEDYERKPSFGGHDLQLLVAYIYYYKDETTQVSTSVVDPTSTVGIFRVYSDEKFIALSFLYQSVDGTQFEFISPLTSVPPYKGAVIEPVQQNPLSDENQNRPEMTFDGLYQTCSPETLNKYPAPASGYGWDGENTCIVYPSPAFDEHKKKQEPPTNDAEDLAENPEEDNAPERTENDAFLICTAENLAKFKATNGFGWTGADVCVEYPSAAYDKNLKPDTEEPKDDKFSPEQEPETKTERTGNGVYVICSAENIATHKVDEKGFGWTGSESCVKKPSIAFDENSKQEAEKPEVSVDPEESVDSEESAEAERTGNGVYVICSSENIATHKVDEKGFGWTGSESCVKKPSIAFDENLKQETEKLEETVEPERTGNGTYVICSDKDMATYQVSSKGYGWTGSESCVKKPSIAFDENK